MTEQSDTSPSDPAEAWCDTERSELAAAIAAQPRTPEADAARLAESRARAALDRGEHAEAAKNLRRAAACWWGASGLTARAPIVAAAAVEVARRATAGQRRTIAPTLARQTSRAPRRARRAVANSSGGGDDEGPPPEPPSPAARPATPSLDNLTLATGPALLLGAP